MALGALQQTIKQNGQLFQTSQEEVGNLASAAGLPATPSTPQETSVIGGTPSQAKMAGTPAQATGNLPPQPGPNAVRMAVQGSKDLAIQLREQQVNTQATPQQQAEIQNQQLVSQLGSSLAARVPQMVNNAISAGTAAAGTAGNLEVDQSKLPANLSDADKTDLARVLQTIGSPVTTANDATAHAQALARANQLLGHDTQHLLTSADLTNMFMDQGTSIANKLAGATPESVSIGSLQPADLGVKSFNDIDQALGLPPGASAKMTVKQLGDAVAAVKAKNYSTADQWRQELADPTTSTQERETARTMLRAMGATGIKEAEAQFSTLRNQVQASNTINFNGKSMSVDDALSSDNVKATVANYLTDPAQAKLIQQNNPDLAKWIDANKDALGQYTANIDQETKDFAALQTSNQATLSGIADPNLRDTVGKLLHPDWGQPTAVSYAPPAMLAPGAVGTQDLASVNAALGSFADSNDTAGMSQLINANPGDLKQIGGGDFATGLKTWADSWKAATVAASVQPNTSPEQIVQDFFGPGTTVPGVTAQAKAANVANQLFGAPAADPGLITAGGTLDMDAVTAAAKGGRISIADMAKGVQPPASAAATLKASVDSNNAWAVNQPAAIGDLYKLVQQNGGNLPSTNDLTAEAGKFMDSSTGKDGYANLDATAAAAQKAGDTRAFNTIQGMIEDRAANEFRGIVNTTIKALNDPSMNGGNVTAANRANWMNYAEALKKASLNQDPRVQNDIANHLATITQAVNAFDVASGKAAARAVATIPNPGALSLPQQAPMSQQELNQPRATPTAAPVQSNERSSAVRF